MEDALHQLPELCLEGKREGQCVEMAHQVALVIELTGHVITVTPGSASGHNGFPRKRGQSSEIVGLGRYVFVLSTRTNGAGVAYLTNT